MDWAIFSVVTTFLLALNTEIAEAGSYCQYSAFGSYYYCYGYCYGYYCDYYYYDYTTYVGALSIGALVGVIFGCLVVLGIIVTVIVIICASCTKTAGQRGRIVHPTNGVSIVTTGNVQQNQFSYPYPTAPPPPPAYMNNGVTYNPSYPQTYPYSNAAPPPAYSTLN